MCLCGGGMGPGCGSSPWPLQGASGLLGRASLVGSGVWPQPPHVHYSKASALSASLLGCLVGWQLQHTAGAQQFSKALGERGGFAASSVPCSHLGPRAACGLHMPKGGRDWIFSASLCCSSSHRFLNILMQGGEATPVPKGRVRGALSCWWAACSSWEHRGWRSLSRATGEGLERAWSCMGAAPWPCRESERARSCCILRERSSYCNFFF